MSCGAHFPGLDLRAVLPEGGAFDHGQVPHHQPVQVGQAEPLHPAVGRANGRVLSHQEVATAVAVHLRDHGLVGAVAAGQPRQVVVTEVVVRRGRLAPPGLEQADQIGAHVRPEAIVHALGVDVGWPGPRCRARAAWAGSRAAGRTGWGCRWSPGWRRARAARGCRRLAGRCCRAAAAGWRRSGCTARPRCAGSSRRCRRTPWSGRGQNWSVTQLADPGERVRWHPAGLLDHLRGVAGEVPLQHLEYAPGVLQRLVPVRVGVRCGAAGAVRLAASRLPHLPLRVPVLVVTRAVARPAAADISPPW